MEVDHINYQGPERRRHPRLNVFLTIHLAEFDTTGLTQNISAGGLCFVSIEQMEGGQELSLELILPGSVDSIAIKAKVVWCKITQTHPETLYKYGVEFIEISDDHRQQVAHYVLKNFSA